MKKTLVVEQKNSLAKILGMKVKMDKTAGHSFYYIHVVFGCSSIEKTSLLSRRLCGAKIVRPVNIVGARPLPMLDQLEPGLWELRLRGPEGGEQRLCLASGRDLIRLRHPGQACTQVVVEDRPGEVTVQYTCPGRGFGRTHIRRETNSLVQIDTQGVAEGLPFQSSIEGRRVGTCERR